MPRHFTLQPDESKDYDFNWSAWFTDTEGDSITSSVVTISPNDGGITLGTKIQSAEVVKQFIAANTLGNGTDYTVTCLMTSGQGRIDEREIFIHVRELA